jgi:hypothetical protein
MGIAYIVAVVMVGMSYFVMMFAALFRWSSVSEAAYRTAGCLGHPWLR